MRRGIIFFLAWILTVAPPVAAFVIFVIIFFGIIPEACFFFFIAILMHRLHIFFFYGRVFFSAAIQRIFLFEAEYDPVHRARLGLYQVRQIQRVTIPLGKISLF